jgi:hypothetical protein
MLTAGCASLSRPGLCHYQERGWSLVRRLSREEWAIEVPPEGSFTLVG